MLGAALRRSGDPAGAAKALKPLALANPGAWGLQFELGAAFAAMGDTAAAVKFLKLATASNPSSSLAWHALGDQLAIQGDHKAADAGAGAASVGLCPGPLLQTGPKALSRTICPAPTRS